MSPVTRITLDPLLRLATLMLVLFIAALLGRLTWLMVEPSSVLPPSRILDAPDPVALPASALAGFRELASLSVLGAARSEQPAAVNAPDTTLKWTLKGVMTDPDPSRSAAILAPQGQPEKLYRVGASLPGNVRLEQILSDRVMLLRDGQLEALRLRRNEVGGRTTPARAPASLPVVDANTSLAADGGVARIDRDAWVNDPQRFMDVISASPVMQGAVMVGLEVRPSRNAREFEAAGLQAGDVITEVEGTPIGDISDYRDLLQELAGASSVSVALERNGEPMHITITMD